jgi:hypothetical protein
MVRSSFFCWDLNNTLTTKFLKLGVGWEDFYIKNKKECRIYDGGGVKFCIKIPLLSS